MVTEDKQWRSFQDNQAPPSWQSEWDGCLNTLMTYVIVSTQRSSFLGTRKTEIWLRKGHGSFMPCIYTYTYIYISLFHIGLKKGRGKHNTSRAVTATQIADTDTYSCVVKVLWCKCYGFGCGKALWGKLSWKKKRLNKRQITIQNMSACSFKSTVSMFSVCKQIQLIPLLLTVRDSIGVMATLGKSN